MYRLLPWPEALEHFERALEIVHRLAEAQPSDAQIQRDLSICHSKIGDAMQHSGRKEEALDHARLGLDVLKKLAAVDAADVQTQRDLMLGHYRLGEMRVAFGDFRLAREEFQVGIAVLKPLLALDSPHELLRQNLAVLEERVQFCDRAELDAGSSKTTNP